MCGIFGVFLFRDRDLLPLLVKGLRRLEYRGYDSFGFYIKPDFLIKRVGSISTFNVDRKIIGRIGIAHTRWATHGKVSERNAHPHFDCKKEIFIVHNGIIDNWKEIKRKLVSRHKFSSETDTELIAHLIEEEKGRLEDRVKKALKKLKGSYALLVVKKDENKIVAARKSSPLLVGEGKDGYYFSSDLAAFAGIVERYFALEDGDIVMVDDRGLHFIAGKKKKWLKMYVKAEEVELRGYPHYMLKEIKEIPMVVKRVCRNVRIAKAVMSEKEYDILGCGTSFYAGKLLEYLLEEKGKNVKAYIASEYYRRGRNVITLSQSGETADLLDTLKETKPRKIVSIVNVLHSSLARMSDVVIPMMSGIEIGVAATKTFYSQISIAYLMTDRKFRSSQIWKTLKKIEKDAERFGREMADLVKDKECKVFFLAKKHLLPVAMEASLKFKEITYIQSEYYPSGEIKHGPLSLIDERAVVFALVDEETEEVLRNVDEVTSRGGKTIILSTVKIPDAYVFRYSGRYTPLVLTLPLYYLAYYTSVKRGLNPDKPRNLAKSVTVK